MSWTQALHKHWQNWQEQRGLDQLPIASGNPMLPPSVSGAQQVGYDIPLLCVISALLCIGFLMVYSTTIVLVPEDASYNSYLLRHSIACILGLGVGWLLYGINSKQLKRVAGVGVLVCTALLLTVVIMGSTAKGSTRWLAIGPVNFQPSELAKLAIILFVASFVDKHLKMVQSSFLRAIAPPAVVFIAFAGLLMLQPDFGTTVIIAAVAVGMLVLGGVKLKPTLVLAAALVAAGAAVILTSDFRRQRFLAYLNPWDPEYALTKGYQLTHSLIAISRGGWTGEGLGASVEKILWLPEAHTDFVLAIFAEEMGLIGVVILLSLYAWMIWRIFKIGQKAVALDHIFAGLTVQGIGLWLAIQTWINFGVVFGVLPTKGLTLPLLSYGSSAMLIALAAFGIVFRVDRENRHYTRQREPIR